MLSICFKLWGKYREKNNPWSKSQNVEKAYLSIPLGKHCGQLTAWTQPPSGPVPTSGQAGYSRCQPGRRDLATGCPLKPLPHPRSCPLPQRCQLPPWLSGDANGVSKTASERNRVNTRHTGLGEEAGGWAAFLLLQRLGSLHAHHFQAFRISSPPEAWDRVKASEASSSTRWWIQQKNTGLLPKPGSSVKQLRELRPVTYTLGPLSRL